MDKIFEKNLEAIKQYHKDLDLEKIMGYKQSEKFVVETCKDGNKTIKVLKDDKYLYLHSLYNPINESEVFVNNLDVETNEDIVFFGIGFAYHIRKLLKLYDSKKNFVAIEPEYDIFNELIRNIDICDILKNDKFKIIIEPTENEYKKYLKEAIDWKNIEEFNFLNFPVYDKIYPEQYIALNKSTTRIYDNCQIIKNTILGISKNWHENTINNLKHLLDSYYWGNLKDKFKNVPVIIVSAGPSLDKNLHLLKDIKGKALVLCTYTAYNSMMKKGIEPDMVISVDPRQLIHETEEQKKKRFSTPLIILDAGSTELLDKHDGKKITLIDVNNAYFINSLCKFNREPEILGTGGSVANNLMDFSFRLGANHIIMIGQDFAYTDNKTHVEGSFYDGKNSIADVKQGMFYIEDINGGQVLTSHDFQVYLNWTVDYIEFRKNDCLFIDATEGGAKIKGTKIMTLQDAIDKYCNVDRKQQIQEAFDEFYEKGHLFTEEEQNILIEELKEMAIKYKKIEELLVFGMSESERLKKLYKHTDTPKNKTVLKILDNLKKMDKEIEDLKCEMKLIEYYFHEASYKIERAIHTKQNEGTRVSNQSYEMYKGMKEAMQETRPLLMQAIKDLENKRSGAK